MSDPRRSLTIDVPFIIESFPAPPTHLPSTLSPAGKFGPPLPLPPPSRPPSLPLPPIPGPSPITDHESLIWLSTRHVSKYNTDRISIISSKGSRESFYSARSVPLASPVLRDDLSPVDSHGALSVKGEVYDYYDDDVSSAYEGIMTDEAVPASSSPSAKVQDFIFDAPPSPHMDEQQELTINLPALISSSSTNPDPNDSISSISMDDLPDPDDDDININPTTGKDELAAAQHALQVHLKMRASRSRSAAHNKHLLSRQHSPEPPNETVNDQCDRVPSPNISTIIQATPRHRNRPKRSVSDTSHVVKLMETPLRNRWSAASDVPPCPASRATDTWDEDGFVGGYGDGNGSDSDSSLDLLTPYSQILLKDGVLSPNSKLLPETISRPQRIASVITNVTKGGLVKDIRDTPQRRTRHRDGKTLRGGLGLTTGLGWSDSEDEDAPSALTRRISSLNLTSDSRSSLSRRSSRAVSIASSKTTHSLRSTRSFSASTTSTHVFPGIHPSVSRSSSQASLRPFPRSMSRETLLEMEEEWEGSEGARAYVKSMPPTSWKRSKAQEAVEIAHRRGNSSKDSTPPSTASSLSGSASPFPRSSLPPSADEFDEDMSLTTTVSLKRDKTLPPLPTPEISLPSSLRDPKKQASLSRIAGSRPRASSLIKPTSNVDNDSTTTSTPHRSISATAPTALRTSSLQGQRASLPRPLKLPLSHSLARRSSPASASDRAAVPVPGIGSEETSFVMPTPSSTFASVTPGRSSTSSRPPSLSKSVGPGVGLRRPSASSSVYTPSRSSSRSSTFSRSVSASTASVAEQASSTTTGGYGSIPSRIGTPSGIGKPRIGTGMVYRKSGGGTTPKRPEVGKAF